MGEKTTNSAIRISSFVLLVVFITLTLSLAALIVAYGYFESDQILAGWLTLIGFLGFAIAAYVLLQIRRRTRRLSIAAHPITTTIECRKCGFKNMREFQRGDFIFKEVDNCQKCNEKMMIAAIYREAKEGEKERFKV